MSTVLINAPTLTFENEEGKIFCEGNLYDMAYAHADLIKNREDVPKKTVYEEVAEMYTQDFRPEGMDNEKYTAAISWGEAITIALEVQNRLDDEKKS